MYTSCPECGTIFRISTQDLRAAEGFVRCGHCSATFNATGSLADEPPLTGTFQQLVVPPEAEPAPAAEPRVETEPVPGFPAEPAGPASPPELQVAGTWVPLPIDEDTLEFDLPEDSWSNFFAGSEPALAPPPRPQPPPQPRPESPPIDAVQSVGRDTVDQAGLYRALAAETGTGLDDDADWQALLAEVPEDDLEPEPVYVVGDDPPAALEPPAPADVPWDEPATELTQNPAPLPRDFAPELATTPAALRDLPRDAPAPRRTDGTAERPFVWEPPPAPRAATPSHWGYTAGSAVAALLLVMQMLHQQRDTLATYPSFTVPVQRLYAALGVPVWPAWDLRAYELRNSEAVADRSSPGALDIIGRVAVVGNERVGLPLVRVTLRDRFGQPLGSRVFQPAEYLGAGTRPAEPVNPGTVIPVEVRLKDPGRDAQGFDVDVCIMSRQVGITCRGDGEPFAR